LGLRTSPRALAYPITLPPSFGQFRCFVGFGQLRSEAAKRGRQVIFWA